MLRQAQTGEIRYFVDILGQSALLVAVTAFALALTALSRNLRNKLVLNYAVLCCVISGWAFCFFLEKVFEIGTFYQLHLGFNLLLAPVSLYFLRVLTREYSKISQWIYFLSVGYVIIVSIIHWMLLGPTPFVERLAYFAPSFLVLECIHRVLKELIGSNASRVRTSTVGFGKRAWLYIGALFILFVAVMDHVPWLGIEIPSVGNILLCIYLFFMSEAIIHQRLLNISGLFNQSLIFVFICLCFTVVYVVLVFWIEDAPALFFLNSFLASFIILMLVDPIRKLTHLGLVKLLSPKYLKLEQIRKQTEKALTGVLDIGGLAKLSVQFLEKVLFYQSATVFVLHAEGARFKRVWGAQDSELLNPEILSRHPLVEFFKRMQKRGEIPVILDHYLENEIDQSTSQAQKQAYDLVLKGLWGLNANIAIPFLDGNTVLGFVVVKAVKPPEPWGNSWGVLSVIYPFFLQAARTLQNMDVYVQLREKDRLAALGEMAAGLAHEIRNPLGAIKGAAQYLESQSKDSPSPFLQVIVEEVNRLNKVVTQFLDYSRPFSNESVESDIGHILERTYALFQNQTAGAFIAGERTAGTRVGSASDNVRCAGDKLGSKSDTIQRVVLELVEPPGGFTMLPKVRCSPEQLKQVLVNLIQNSFQAMDKPEGKILIGARYEKLSNPALLQDWPGTNPTQLDEVVLFVEDNGRGIPPSQIEKVFIPFFTTTQGGTGLGLPICARIIEAHGGRIEVISEEGKMSRFLVHLPVLKKTDS